MVLANAAEVYTDGGAGSGFNAPQRFWAVDMSAFLLILGRTLSTVGPYLEFPPCGPRTTR